MAAPANPCAVTQSMLALRALRAFGFVDRKR